MLKRKNHSPDFKAKVLLQALKCEQTVFELASWFGVHPMMIHRLKRALLAYLSGAARKALIVNLHRKLTQFGG